MGNHRHDRVTGVVWSVYAQEMGTDADRAQLLPHACCLRPALRAIRLGQAIDDWSLVALPPRTFYTLMAAVAVLRAEAPMPGGGIIDAWCRYNEQSMHGTALSTVPRRLPWTRTLADVRNAAIVLGPTGDVDLTALEQIAEAQRRPHAPV